MELELKQLQRRYQEIHNQLRLSGQKTETAQSEASNAKKVTAKLEAKLGPLQVKHKNLPISRFVACCTRCW